MKLLKIVIIVVALYCVTTNGAIIRHKRDATPATPSDGTPSPPSPASPAESQPPSPPAKAKPAATPVSGAVNTASGQMVAAAKTPLSHMDKVVTEGTTATQDALGFCMDFFNIPAYFT